MDVSSTTERYAKTVCDGRTQDLASGPADEVRQAYADFDREAATEAYRSMSGHGFEAHAVIPSFQAKEQQKSIFAELARRAEGLPTPDPMYEILKEHLMQFLLGRVSLVDTTYARPARFIGSQTRIVDYISRQDSRPAEERLDVLNKRLDQMDAVWAGVRSVWGQVPREAVADIGRACEVLAKVSSNVRARIPQYYAFASQSAMDLLARRLEDLAEKSMRWRAEAEAESRNPAHDDGQAHISHDTVSTDTVSPGRPADEVIGESARLRYKTILRDELGVSLDELLDWHESEIAGTRAELLEAARQTGLRKVEELSDAFEILNQHGGPCDSIEEMFARMERYVADARAACRDGYVDLPHEMCLVMPTPEQTRDDFPWGGYGAGCWRRRPLVGEVFLNETNYKAVTDGWLKMMAIHECYPGHHAQFVRTTVDSLPETVKIGSRYIPLLEGTAHRSERMMEWIFDDPAFPLFVRLRRHHTAVRIKADLYLHYFGRPVDDAMELYMKELGFDRGSARGQVRYQERNPGYMTCYYYGMKRLADLQSRSGLDDKAFTQELFNVGHLSLDGFAKYLALSEADKQRFRSWI